MGRKTVAAESADRFDYASSEAARILAGDLQALSTAMREWLRAADKASPYERGEMLKEAMTIAHAAAKTGETISRLKGQHISVERVTAPDLISPKSAPNSDGAGESNPKQSAGFTDTAASEMGGGGSEAGSIAEPTLDAGEANIAPHPEPVEENPWRAAMRRLAEAG
jgi:hypothetical protein